MHICSKSFALQYDTHAFTSRTANSVGHSFGPLLLLLVDAVVSHDACVYCDAFSVDSSSYGDGDP